MNDTTTTTPATPNELLSENHDLLYKLLAVIETHVNQLVERRVNQVMENHASLRFIDDAFSDRIKEIAKDIMDEHESDYEHPSNDEVSDIAMTHIVHHNFDDQIRRSVEEIISDGDYATEERVQEMIDEHDYEESVKEVLRNI
jgi:uncharacterized protein YbcC (UPF0753/DUF2309 family)